MAAQPCLCLAWSETPEDMICRVVAHMYFYGDNFNKQFVLKNVREIEVNLKHESSFFPTC